MPLKFSNALSESTQRRPGAVRTMSRQEFGAHFSAASRVLWLIAVGIVGDASEAEDVVQDAAVVAFRKRHEFQAGSSFRAWVGAIVRNVALNAKRSQRRRRGAVNGFTETLPEEGAPPGGQEAVPRIDQGLDARVLSALGEIGDIARACLLLRTVGDLQYAEIASVLQIPEGTAMSHVHRSRATLRERLAPVWREHQGLDQRDKSKQNAE